MDKAYFYTIMQNGKYINSNIIKEPTTDITEAIKFHSEEELINVLERDLLENLRKDNNVKILEVECIIREY